jgi:redox-sensitive bicupin YhaK (pirin superfamily)
MSDRVRSVGKVLAGRPATDGAGVRITRVIATPELDHYDPFLLLDEFRSDNPDDYIAGFPDHPHRGFETVTYMLAGAMEHADNQGNSGLLGPGSVQWMTAGRGIVHSEMPRQDDGLMWGFQLWVNLPARDKMTAPRYQDIPAAHIPMVEAGRNVTVRVVAGRFGDATGPVEAVATQPLYLDVRMQGGGDIDVPVADSLNAFIYVYTGDVEVAGDHPRRVSRGEIALLGDGTLVRVASGRPANFLLVAGRPLNEPVARYGPFVMNTADELRQAFADYQAGRF